MNILDKTKPLPSEYINTFYDYLTNLKELFLDRFGLDHNMDGVLDTSLPTADGYHKHLTMRDYEDVDEYQNSIYFPWYTEDSQQLFVKQIDGLHELCSQNDDGIRQITDNGEETIGLVWDILLIESGWSVRDCIYFNNMYIFVGSSGKIYTSPDLETFTLRQSNTTVGFTRIEEGGGKLVVLGADGFISTSTDGITWTTRTSPIATSLYNIIYNNGIFLVSSQGSYMTSPDGETWTLRTFPVSFLNMFTTKLNNKIYASVQNGVTGNGITSYNYIYSTIDGINWVQLYYYSYVQTSVNQKFVYGIAFLKNVLAVGWGNATEVLISYDYGNTWENFTIATQCYGLQSIGNYFYTAYYRSKDGLIWERFESYTEMASWPFPKKLHGLIFGGKGTSPYGVYISKYKELI